MINVLVSAAGSVGAINYVRALREGLPVRVVGTDYYPMNAKMNRLDVFYKSPKHHRPDFPQLIMDVVRKEKIGFVHPSIESEARVIAIHCDVPAFLPKIETSALCFSKYEVCKLLSEKGLATEPYYYSQNKKNLNKLFEQHGSPLWVRLQTGAGARGSLACKTPQVIHKWVNLLTSLNKGKEKDVIIQPFLNGKDYAFDSIWFCGKLLASFVRERESYIFPHLSLSGITGTPTISRIVHDSKINDVAVKAILALDSEPHGVFCVDLKGHDGDVYVTEVNCKPHTTMFLWGFVVAKMGRPDLNLAVYYTLTGLHHEAPYGLPAFDVYPEGWVLLRNIDAGVRLLVGDAVIGAW